MAAANGILAINESPNGAMAATNLPPAFIWKDGGIATNASGVDGVVPASQQEILTMWWEGSCDTYCFRAYPGCDMAVSYDWRGEDSGPNVGRAEDILGMYAAARARQLRHHFGPCLTQLSNLSWMPSFLFPPPTRPTVATVLGCQCLSDADTVPKTSDGLIPIPVFVLIGQVPER